MRISPTRVMPCGPCEVSETDWVKCPRLRMFPRRNGSPVNGCLQLVTAAAFANARATFLRRFGGISQFEHHSDCLSFQWIRTGFALLASSRSGGDACTLACTLYCIVWGKRLPTLACKCVLSFRYTVPVDVAQEVPDNVESNRVARKVVSRFHSFP